MQHCVNDENVKLEVEKLINWLKERVKEANAKGVVFGLSGGIDSSVVAALSVRAFGENALGIIMPCESNENDEKDARLVAESIGLKIEKVDLTNVYTEMINSSFVANNKMAIANIKPRLRMTTLYYYAQEHNYLVCGCSNASELYIGYYTKYGDSGSDIIPLAEYLKDEVFKLGEYLNIPNKILTKAPSAGLWEAQTDEKEMGFSYDDLNKHIRGEKVDDKITNRIEDMHRKSKHKREFAKMYNRE